MKIAITGASGQMGRTVADDLLQKVPPEDLILISRSPAKLSAYADRGCDIRQGDFDDREGLAKALSGAERMLMISGTLVGYREPQHSNAVNAAVAAGVRHVVYTSFVGSDASNPSMAAKDHIITEQLLRQSGLDFTFLRNAQYSEAVLDAMGPAVIASGLMLSVAGDGAMAFVCRDDCAAAAAAVLASSGHEGQTYDITGPDLISYREVAQLIADVSGAPVTFELTDEAGLYAMFDALGIPRKPVDGQNVNNFPWNSDDMVSFEVAVRDGYFAVFSNHVEQLTGRRPRSLRSLLEDNRDALMAGAARIAAPA